MSTAFEGRRQVGDRWRITINGAVHFCYVSESGKYPWEKDLSDKIYTSLIFISKKTLVRHSDIKEGDLVAVGSGSSICDAVE
jgi:hypothetical protein